MNAVITILLSLLLSACSSPYIKSRFDLSSAQYLNPNVAGHSSPVTLTFYQLRSANSFNRLSYQQITQHPNQFLGTVLLDKSTLLIRPNQQRKFSLKLAKSTQYVGIVAGFRNLANAKWRRTIKVPDNTDTFRTTIYVSTNGLQTEVRE